MNIPRKKLPIGIQTFREIREEDYYYIDKTPLALRLIERGSYYLLSRPRGFGKSLFLDTLAELFEGNRALFTGLAAEEHWDWSRRFPVIRLSFAHGVLADRAELDAKIEELLAENAARLQVQLDQNTISGQFGDLIRQAHANSGERVVVLVDEYDKPIRDNLTNPETASVLHVGLLNLYSVIKEAGAHIHFALLAGVCKVSTSSIFSGLNNLMDLSLDADYSAICGYTDNDLDTVFAPELDGLDRAQMRAWYSGYNWTGESVYNPIDVLQLLQKRKFQPWWFETATPDSLIDVLTERQVFLPQLSYMLADRSRLLHLELERIAIETLLFQTGHLTIDSNRQIGVITYYSLHYPNREVYQSLNNRLLQHWTPDTQNTFRNKTRLGELLLANDFAGLEQLFTAFYASIPHDWYRNTPIAQYEGYYASIFYAYFASLGLDLTPEDTSNVGRLDLALRFNGNLYLMEFKVVELVPDGRALEQIKARGYADKYRAEGLPIHLMGIEFSKEQRALVGFEVETLES